MQERSPTEKGSVSSSIKFERSSQKDPLEFVSGLEVPSLHLNKSVSCPSPKVVCVCGSCCYDISLSLLSVKLLQLLGSSLLLVHHPVNFNPIKYFS